MKKEGETNRLRIDFFVIGCIKFSQACLGVIGRWSDTS